MPDDLPPSPPAPQVPPARAPGPIRPQPVRPAVPRLPGTYAASFERDMDWRRGAAMLWTIFILSALCELTNAVWYYLSGGINNLVTPGALRVVVESVLFLALWKGQNWARWSLAVLNFLGAGWIVVWFLALHAEAASACAAAGEPAPGYGVESIPVCATAMVYLFAAGYLAFSADVLDFLRHRREVGRGRAMVPMKVSLGCYLALIFGIALVHAVWLGVEEVSARNFAMQSLSEMSYPWSAATYERLADPNYLATWYQGDRVNTFAKLSPLGAFDRSEYQYATGVMRWDTEHGGVLVVINCDLGPARFAHGRARFSAVVSRHFPGAWKMGAFRIDDVQMDVITP